MADLDDFFAKKDKKKKGTKKFSKANTDVVAKNLEEAAIKDLKQQDKDVANMGEEKNPEKINQQDDDEWDDYRENKKDYTGLKIDNLVIQEPVKVEEEETEINEDGEIVKVKKDESGPWNKKDGENRGSMEETPEPEDKKNQPIIMEQPNVVGGSYVPPHMRGAGGGTTPDRERAEPRRTVPRRMRAAPDISSEVYFPSLSSAAEDAAPKGAWGKKLVKDEGAFEEVRGEGKSQVQHRNNDGPKITLGNKFDALRDE
eukprot:GFUD01016009.1.p1 GENE.GFUD01016009.1~~GFUD01016009.1.p1  ORF type:complete len:257 (-),score=100.29 GFUD01016009.1:331-1101(-)